MRDLLKFIIYLFGALIHHNRKSKVLYYHDVGTLYTEMGTPLSLLQAHVSQIQKAGFTIVDRIKNPDNQVVLAFDDGWKGLYDNRSFFLENGIHPTVFIAVGLIGNPGYMNREEIRELIHHGFIFQAHSWSHTGLPEHHGEDLLHELIDSRLELERLFSMPFKEICFPQGRFSSEVIVECETAGYTLMYSSLPGSFYDYIDRKLICRNLMQYTPTSQVKFILTGDVPLLRKHYFKQHFTHKNGDTGANDFLS